jgi:transcriptional regulator with XRE-family HTH domain
MESPGARLKKIRLEKGLSLEDVHKKTKVHLNILKAMEEDSLIGLNPVYTKGFLKIYCNFLDTDPRDFIIDYKEPRSHAKIAADLSGGKEPVASLTRITTFKFKTLRPYINLKSVSIFILVIFFSVLLFKLPKIFSKRALALPKDNSPIVVLPKKIEKTVPVASQQKTPLATEVRLGIWVKEDCLVKVKLDGRLMVDRVFKKGTRENWLAKEKIELSLGNAAAVELEVNDKRIPPVGRKGKPAKNIVITKNGLIDIPR